MDYKRFFIWVEGDDDERFFKEIIEPKLAKYFDYIKIGNYSAINETQNINIL